MYIGTFGVAVIKMTSIGYWWWLHSTVYILKSTKLVFRGCEGEGEAEDERDSMKEREGQRGMEEGMDLKKIQREMTGHLKLMTTTMTADFTSAGIKKKNL